MNQALTKALFTMSYPFQHLSVTLLSFTRNVIPNVPKSLRTQMSRERILARENQIELRQDRVEKENIRREKEHVNRQYENVNRRCEMLEETNRMLRTEMTEVRKQSSATNEDQDNDDHCDVTDVR